MTGDNKISYFVFVDNSNVWIEGKRASAVQKGSVTSMQEAHDRNIEDSSWRIDFGRLLNLITGGHTEFVKKAVLFGSKPPQNDTLWRAAQSANFEVKINERNAANKEKNVDTSMAVAAIACLYKEAKIGDVFVFVTGDGDFSSAITQIKSEKNQIKIAFWENASKTIKEQADEFINLSKKINDITWSPYL